MVRPISENAEKQILEVPFWSQRKYEIRKGKVSGSRSHSQEKQVFLLKSSATPFPGLSQMEREGAQGKGR